MPLVKVMVGMTKVGLGLAIKGMSSGLSGSDPSICPNSCRVYSTLSCAEISDRSANGSGDLMKGLIHNEGCSREKCGCCVST